MKENKEKGEEKREKESRGFWCQEKSGSKIKREKKRNQERGRGKGEERGLGKEEIKHVAMKGGRERGRQEGRGGGGEHMSQEGYRGRKQSP